jgi:tRNA (guanine37-N1)-methyltransferase
MNINVLTLFPEMFEGFKTNSIIKRALGKGVATFDVTNIRSYSKDKWNRVDNHPIGGGAGLIEQCQPILDALSAVRKPNSHVILMSPRGHTYDQETAKRFAKLDDLIIICGHYEGIDERVLEEIVTDNISIGDYVLTGGELPALVMMDAVSRLITGVLNNDESATTESFNDGLLEYPQYTRPEEWRGKKVPEILLSGHHGNVEKWRLEQSIERTRERRPDLYEKYMELHPPVPEKKKRRRKKKTAEPAKTDVLQEGSCEET